MGTIMLGDLLSRLTDEATALEAIAGLGDLKLLTEAQELAAAEGLDLGSYVAQAVERYANEASNEEWTTLMGLLNRTQDPGAICIKRALAHALRE
jgi:hypothetical protein